MGGGGGGRGVVPPPRCPPAVRGGRTPPDRAAMTHGQTAVHEPCGFNLVANRSYAVQLPIYRLQRRTELVARRRMASELSSSRPKWTRAVTFGRESTIGTHDTLGFSSLLAPCRPFGLLNPWNFVLPLDHQQQFYFSVGAAKGNQALKEHVINTLTSWSVVSSHIRIRSRDDHDRRS